jgi:hydrogenase nickel incorporation protein HypA/HybF
MHELSICASIASIVRQHAADRRVEVVRLDVGQFRQVVPETLRYSWEVVVDGTPLAGSRLEINHIAAVIECRSCGVRTTLERPVMRCGCGSTDVILTSGEELLVTSLELDRTGA